jgi:hypothetical protein
LIPFYESPAGTKDRAEAQEAFLRDNAPDLVDLFLHNEKLGRIRGNIMQNENLFGQSDDEDEAHILAMRSLMRREKEVLAQEASAHGGGSWCIVS